ncbi:uncharacterized protein BDZ99DRAFT_183109 [Mytilinidion resinicola]|uniref:Uncharacterized protein n=1 Tax=Mytilinidion resinicola TaxID=574789 RepID=A0A6A6Z1K8_9PEZI|nr:uncharacterized protein BDZ99DRAFT_183109 [Mytilinidion resinicola]KAF2814688.1 hypothetical protein BDZ99DRAFT_183109 [Mytilinidion resinicola]
MEDLKVWRLGSPNFQRRSSTTCPPRQDFPFSVSPPSFSLGCDSRFLRLCAAQLLGTSTKVTAIGLGFRHGENGVRCSSTQHRHQIVLLCVSPAFVRFFISLVSLAAGNLGAIHAYQQMIEHRQWEAAYFPGRTPGQHLSTAPSL